MSSAAQPALGQPLSPAATPQPAAPTSWAPTAKVSAGVLAASLTTLIIGFAKTHNWANIEAADGAALTSVLTFIVQYLVPERR